MPVIRDTIRSMLYALIGSGLFGALSTAFLLWRKSVVETKLSEARAIGREAILGKQEALMELVTRQNAFDKQLALQTSQLETIKAQRDAALKAITGAPGSIAELIKLRALQAKS